MCSLLFLLLPLCMFSKLYPWLTRVSISFIFIIKIFHYRAIAHFIQPFTIGWRFTLILLFPLCIMLLWTSLYILSRAKMFSKVHHFISLPAVDDTDFPVYKPNAILTDFLLMAILHKLPSGISLRFWRSHFFISIFQLMATAFTDKLLDRCYCPRTKCSLQARNMRPLYYFL